MKRRVFKFYFIMYKMAKAVRNERLERIKNSRENGRLFIPACLFLGLGWGIVVDKVAGGLFIGLGVGFLLF